MTGYIRDLFTRSPCPHISVQPTIHISKSLIGCPIGEAVTLSCTVEAYPDPISYWIRRPSSRPGVLGALDDGRRHALDPAEMIMSSANFEVVTLRSGDEYKETISLTIKKFQASDEGTYTCTSTNSLGKKESTVRLYGKPIRTPIISGKRGRPPASLFQGNNSLHLFLLFKRSNVRPQSRR